MERSSGCPPSGDQVSECVSESDVDNFSEVRRVKLEIFRGLGGKLKSEGMHEMNCYLFLICSQLSCSTQVELVKSKEHYMD